MAGSPPTVSSTFYDGITASVIRSLWAYYPGEAAAFLRFSGTDMDRHSFYPLFLLTILMVAVGQMTQTLYVPSIPMMAGD
ncbi:MAG: hypothetical protein ACRCZ8_07460, partial [Aeromonas sobria]